MIAMEITPLSIKDILLLKPRIYKDKRGYLYESFNEAIFNKLLKTQIHFVQEIKNVNISNSENQLNKKTIIHRYNT